MVEQLLGSELSVEEWCARNGMKKSNMYYWLERFKESDPELFGGYEIAHCGDGCRQWFKEVRSTLRASMSLSLQQPSAPCRSPEPARSEPVAAFAVVDTADLFPAGQRAPQPAPGRCEVLTVRAGGIEVDVPVSAAAQVLQDVLRAVSAL